MKLMGECVAIKIQEQEEYEQEREEEEEDGEEGYEEEKQGGIAWSCCGFEQ